MGTSAVSLGPAPASVDASGRFQMGIGPASSTAALRGPEQTFAPDDRFGRIEELFMRALEQPAEVRDAWLVQMCAGDPQAYAEVSVLLALDAQEGPDRLQPPAERLLAEDELTEGAIIDGRYRIGERLGAGGLGVVHRAEQLEPVTRSVALKVGRRGLDDAAALALFQAESRALSLVSHPGIAQVYDAGRTVGGRFYVAMELVDGLPLTTYCARHKLDLTARLRLFIDVCRAVQHAHQRGVIHRDLKPSNVLVTRHGDIAWPKVIDFGIAKAAGSEHGDAIEPIAGTPAYMSPEQAADTGLGDVDTRADVYSLGVMLYELLTGGLPFSTSAATRGDLASLREVLRGPFVSPSTRVRADLKTGVTRHSVGPVESSALKGDLDAVVGKAMAHDRAARYATVSELAADLDRVLHRYPVSARLPTAAYLFRSFVRRHRVLVVSLSLLLLGVIAAGIAMAQLSADRVEQRRIAEREAATAQAQREIADRTSRLAERLQVRSLLNAAKAAFDVGDAGTTRANLEAIPLSYRGFEWNYLHLESDRSEVTLSGAGPAITALAVSSLAGGLGAGDAQGLVRVWAEDQPGAPRLRWQTQAHNAAVAALALSPDGGLLATSDLVEKVRVWDVETGVMLWERSGVVSVGRGAFSPDGTRLVFGGFGEHAVSVHDAVNGELLDRITINAPTAYRPSFVGEGAVIFTDLSRTIRLDLYKHEVAWVSPSRFVELAGPDRFVARILPNYGPWSLFDAHTGDEAIELGDTLESVEALDVSPDGASTVRGGASTVLTLDATRSGTVDEPQELPGHLGAITAIVYAADGAMFYSGDAAGSIKGWKAATLTQPFVTPSTNDRVFAGATSRDGTRVVTGGWGGVKCWDARLGVELWTRIVGRAYVSALAVDKAGEAVAVGDWRGVVQVLGLEDGAERARIELGPVRIFAVAWAPDSTLIVGREDGQLIVVDPINGRTTRHGGAPTNALAGSASSPWRNGMLTVAAHRSAVLALVFSPDGELVASGSGDGTVWPVINEERPGAGADASVRLWRWPGLEPVAVLPGHGASVRSLAFAPDGRRLVSGGSDRTLRAWSVPDGALIATRLGVGHQVTAVGFTADGARLVTAHGEGPLLIWDATEFDLLMSLGANNGHVLTADFAPDGRALTAVSRRSAVVRFETERVPERQRERAEVLAARAALFDFRTGLSVVRVEAALKASHDIAAAVVGRAVEMARARGDHSLMLNSAAWGRLLTPGQSWFWLQRALEDSETSVAARPLDWQSWNTLSLAHYRVGQLEAALAAADRSKELQRQVGFPDHPVVESVRVLILAALLRVDEARAQLEAARPGLTRDDVRMDHEAFALFAEAEAAVLAKEASTAPHPAPHE